MKSDYYISNCISFVHSFTLFGRLLRSDWKGLLEGCCTSLAVPYPIAQGTVATLNTGWGKEGAREECTTGEALKLVVFSLKEEDTQYRLRF